MIDPVFNYLFWTHIFNFCVAIEIDFCFLNILKFTKLVLIRRILFHWIKNLTPKSSMEICHIVFLTSWLERLIPLNSFRAISSLKNYIFWSSIFLNIFWYLVKVDDVFLKLILLYFIKFCKILFVVVLFFDLNLKFVLFC